MTSPHNYGSIVVVPFLGDSEVSIVWLRPDTIVNESKAYNFTITAGNATAGATYINNGITYTVLNTIHSGVMLETSGEEDPSLTGVLTKTSGIGDASLTFSSFWKTLVNEVIYQHKIWIAGTTEPSIWGYLGTNSSLKTIDVGDRLKGYYVYKFGSLNNSVVYNIKIRVVDPADVEDITLVGESLQVTPSVIQSDEPTIERLMRGLDKKYSKDTGSNIYKIFEVISIHLRNFYLDFKNLAIPQLNILTSTDEFVDTWGFLFNVTRVVNETDEEFSQRIVRSILIEKGTKNGLIRALTPYAEVGSTIGIVDGSLNFNSMYFDNSYFDYSPYSPDPTDATVPSVAGIEKTIISEALGLGYHVNLNGLIGGKEYSFGNELGSAGMDSFRFIVRILSKASGYPSSKANTLNKINEIIKGIKTAGTDYDIFEIGYLGGKGSIVTFN